MSSNTNTQECSRQGWLAHACTHSIELRAKFTLYTRSLYSDESSTARAHSAAPSSLLLVAPWPCCAAPPPYTRQGPGCWCRTPSAVPTTDRTSCGSRGWPCSVPLTAASYSWPVASSLLLMRHHSASRPAQQYEEAGWVSVTTLAFLMLLRA